MVFGTLSPFDDDYESENERPGITQKEISETEQKRERLKNNGTKTNDRKTTNFISTIKSR